MIQLAYVSSAFPALSRAELDAILEKSRDKNRRLGVTGLLVYKDGNILQVLEGDSTAVLPLFETISRDVRHRGVIRLYSKPITQRDFPDWAIGFRDLNAEAGDAQEGRSLVLEPGFDLRTLGESQAARLVAQFKSNIR